MNFKDIKLILKDKGLIKLNINLDHNSNLYKYAIQHITGYSNIVKTGNINYDISKVGFDNPYYGNEKLEFHNDGLGEKNINPLYLFLKCNVKAKSGGENFFVDSKSIIKFIPESYLFLKYNFSLFSSSPDNIENLFIKHPLGGYLCLNYTLYGIDINGNSSFIKFIGKTDKENKEINSFLYNLIEKNKFIIDINKRSSIIFDNYRYLHGRNSFTGYRELERALIYF